MKKFLLLFIFIILFLCSSNELSANRHEVKELELDLAYARSLIIIFPENLDSNYYISKTRAIEHFVLSQPSDYQRKNILLLFAKEAKGELEILVDFKIKSYLFKIHITQEKHSEDLNFDASERSSQLIKFSSKKYFVENTLIPVKTSSYFWDSIFVSEPNLINLERLYGIDDEEFFKSIIFKVKQAKACSYGDLIIPTENFIYKVPFKVLDKKEKEKNNYEITEALYLD